MSRSSTSGAQRYSSGERSKASSSAVVPRARMTDLVLRDRRERDVLFQQRRDARPFRVAPAEDQLVVSDLQEQLLFLLCHVPPSTSPSRDSRPRGGSCG